MTSSETIEILDSLDALCRSPTKHSYCWCSGRQSGGVFSVLVVAAGFTRRYIENPSMVACGNEPLQLLSVFTALEKSQDAIGITCEDHILQYALSIR